MWPPGLSMLWESVEPAAELTERFGFSDSDSVADWVSTLLDQTWTIDARGCPRLVISGQNAIGWVQSDQGDLVVPTRGPWPPVAAPIATAGGLGRVIVDGPCGALSVSVLPELAGDWLDMGDCAAVHAAGAGLAQLHKALGASHDELLAMTPPTSGLKERIENWLTPGDRGFAPEASVRLNHLLNGLPDLDDVPQLVHNDFRAANLFQAIPDENDTARWASAQ